jgi:hypothetical protein
MHACSCVTWRRILARWCNARAFAATNAESFGGRMNSLKVSTGTTFVRVVLQH